MAKHIIAEMTMTCGACPSQWEGETADGKFVYIRYRHGWFGCGLGDTDYEAVLNEMTPGKQAVFMYVPREADGYMEWDEMMALTADIFDWSKIEVPA